MNDTEYKMNGESEKKSRRFPAIPLTLSALTVGLTALSAFLFSAGLALTAIIVSAICAGVFSTLLTSVRSMWCTAILPVSFAAAFFSGGIWCAAFASAFAAVASVVMICIQKKTRSATAVNYSAAAVGVFVAVLTVVYIALSNGGLSLDLLKTEFDAFFADMSETLTEALDESGYSGLLGNALAAYQMAIPELVTAIVSTIKYLSPSLLIASVWLYAFISVQFFKITVFILSLTLILPDPKWRYEPNVISARIYLVDYFIYLFISLMTDGTNVVQIAVENLLYILLFPMMAAGIASIAVSFRNPMLRGRSFFTLMILAAALIFIPTVFLFLLAMMGAFYVIFGYRRQKAKQDKSENEGGGV